MYGEGKGKASLVTPAEVGPEVGISFLKMDGCGPPNRAYESGEWIPFVYGGCFCSFEKPWEAVAGGPEIVRDGVAK